MATADPMKLKGLIGNQAYIYGTGNFALRIKNVLSKENIDVNAFLELNKEISTYDRLPVYKLDDFQNLDKSIPVIIGLGNPQADINIVTKELELSGFRTINPIQFAINAFNSGYPFENYWLTGDLSIYTENYQQIQKARALLSDEKSKQIFDDILCYRQTGKIEYLPQKSHVSEQYLAPDLPWGGLLRQSVRMLDCGAFDGDTFENFRDNGIAIEYWNFVEPDPINFAKIRLKFAHSLKNASYTQAGVSNSNEYLGFESNSTNNGSKFSKNSDNLVKIICIDEMPDSKVFNFIKFDIEGEELNALKGAVLTIERNKPLMAISIYHLPSHHWEILNFLSTLQSTYSYFLRVHGEQTFDTVLYVFPN